MSLVGDGKLNANEWVFLLCSFLWMWTAHGLNAAGCEGWTCTGDVTLAQATCEVEGMLATGIALACVMFAVLLRALRARP